MELSLLQLEAIVRNRICGVCTDRNTEGQCGLDEPSNCALFRLFPEVAAAIQSVQSDDIRVYIQAIRKNVCTVCAAQAADGSCETRQQVQCALDAYLLPVVEAIEEATARSFDRRSVSALHSGPVAGSVIHLGA
ncbi:MAG TPA: hypothetical protein VNY05_03865 [Candidatus Acidoferrales bacterium]|nr:hypothetical protein [Candidatus Acidoferrales bacterium]